MGKCDGYTRMQQMNASLNSQQYDIIMLLICKIQKHQYLRNGKRYSKKENAIALNSTLKSHNDSNKKQKFFMPYALLINR